MTLTDCHGRSRKWFVPNRLIRYSTASVGPIASAAAQFALSFVLLHKLGDDDFGRFSFLLVISQLSWGLWGALFCAPLPALLVHSDSESRRRILRSVMSANAAAAALAFFVFMLLAFLVNVGLAATVLFAGSATVGVLRWYARAESYATGALFRPVASDATYACVLLVGTIAMFVTGSGSLELAFGLLLFSTTLALLPFGVRYITDQFLRNRWSEVWNYGAIWRQHSRWSLLGVITTEATANAHVYIVTLVFGPGAYAPLAASALLIRPVQVAMNALSEFERAQMARQIGARRLDLAKSSAQFFRGALLVVWVLTGLVLVSILALAPRLIFPHQYDMSTLIVGSALWMAVAAVRLLRTPDSVLLQAGGAFQPLASASLLSAIGSVVAVAVMLSIWGPLWSICGILLGEMLFAGFIWWQARKWYARAAVESASLDKVGTGAAPVGSTSRDGRDAK